MADGQVVFEIKGDPKDINQTVKQVTSNIQSESKKWDQSVGESTDKMSKSFSAMKTVAAGAIAAIGTALLKFGKEAIDAASDLSEVQNVVDTVFGDGAKQIETWSQKAGQQFGLTETQAKRFTSTLGAMMKSSGLAGKEIVNMSTDLAGLAADMASFYNLDFETAFEKIRSGISGETMPLKQLGINMSVANLQAFALAQGLEKTFSEMDQGEQTMLRYQYLMQATADAQGDFEKTSDGFANAQRRIESSLDSIKTSVGELLIEPFEKATAGVANFLAQIASDMMPKKTVIDEFNEIQLDTETKLAEIQATYDSANDLIKILKEIEEKTVTLQDGTTVSLSSLFGDLSKIEKEGGDIQQYIQSLGLDVDYVVLEYNKWKEATRQLTSLVPSLTSVIDSETGAIKGGTDALQKNLDEWKKNEENKVYWAEYYAKAEAVARAKGEQAGIQITARARQLAAEREARKLAEQYGTTFSDGKIWDRFTGEAKVKYESGEFNNEEVDAAFENYNRLVREADQAQKEAEQSANDLADAEALLADQLTAVEEKTGETLESHNKAADGSSKLTKAIDTMMASLEKQKVAYEEAKKAVDDYYKGVQDSTAQAVKSVVKGFEELTTPYDQLKEKQQKLAEETGDAEKKYVTEIGKLRKDFGDDWMKKLQELGEESKEWKGLTDKEKEAYNALVKLRNEQKQLNDSVEEYSPESLKKKLESQIEYMREYTKNLNQLKAWGVSDEMLAYLSDGSEESAAYLQALVNGGETAAKEVGEKFDEVSKETQSFTDTLTKSKLSVDETWKSLVANMNETLSGLNMSEKTKENVAATIQGIADGISSKIPAVNEAINNLLNAMNPLAAFGFTLSASEDGGITFNLPEIPHFAGGADWIPSNNFPAFLDYGEAVLTAEENKIWQMFKNGQQPTTMDYDALGGVMRDNVKTGGDVYLDRRIVGEVVSSAQAQSYKNQKRSGWQG